MIMRPSDKGVFCCIGKEMCILHQVLIEKLAREHDLTDKELQLLIEGYTEQDILLLAEYACAARNAVYGSKVYMRGLIEFSSYCSNDCLYCGLRKSNTNLQRYHLTDDEIIAYAVNGYNLGFRSFVLQSGEDSCYTDDRLCEIITRLRKSCPESCIMLSVGERSRESAKRLYEAGAERYMLRHETADPQHYKFLRNTDSTLRHRIDCLRSLKDIGFSTGCGFIVGSPHQTVEFIVKDLRFIKTFGPHIVGIGPFVPQDDTPFRDEPPGTVELTLVLLSIIRLLLPDVMLPATTSLSTVTEHGRERGILSGANVLVTNLAPRCIRKQYAIYNNRPVGEESIADNIEKLRTRILLAGGEIDMGRGDHISCT